MSCTSCNGHPLHNCDCTTYQLPVGPTGAAGATGATGATGPAGANIIADILVNQSTTTTGAYETLYTYTLSNPSPLDEAGDTLIIKAFWSTNLNLSSAYRLTKVSIGGNEIAPFGMTGTYVATVGAGTARCLYEVALTRVTASTCSGELLIKPNTGLFIPAAVSAHWPTVSSVGYQTVNNGATTLDSGALTITFQAYSNTVADVTLDRIQIQKLEKL